MDGSGNDWESYQARFLQNYCFVNSHRFGLIIFLKVRRSDTPKIPESRYSGFYEPLTTIFVSWRPHPASQTQSQACPETNLTRMNRLQLVTVNRAGLDVGTFVYPDHTASRRSFMHYLAPMTGFFQRCWIAARYMRRLNYSPRLAWVTAAR